jgi:hypothetical protein
MLYLEYKFVVGNTRQPVKPAGKSYNFGLQQLENKFVVGNARQPIYLAGKT